MWADIDTQICLLIRHNTYKVGAYMVIPHVSSYKDTNKEVRLTPTNKGYTRTREISYNFSKITPSTHPISARHFIINIQAMICHVIIKD